MAVNDPATILLRGLDWAIKSEALSSAIVTPGHLLETVAGVVAPHSTASGFSQKVFARRDLPNAGDIDVDYASGDLVRVGHARSGDIVNAIINSGAGVTLDDDLVSDGAGGLITATTEEEDVFVGRALATVADPVTGIARVEVEIY